MRVSMHLGLGDIQIWCVFTLLERHTGSRHLDLGDLKPGPDGNHVRFDNIQICHVYTITGKKRDRKYLEPSNIPICLVYTVPGME